MAVGSLVVRDGLGLGDGEAPGEEPGLADADGDGLAGADGLADAFAPERPAPNRRRAPVACPLAPDVDGLGVAEAAAFGLAETDPPGDGEGMGDGNAPGGAVAPEPGGGSCVG